MCCKNRRGCSYRNNPTVIYEPSQSLVGMLVRHLIEKRDAKRAHAQQPYIYEAMQSRRGSWEKDQVYSQGRKAGLTEWVDEKEDEAMRQCRETLIMGPPTYGQVMKEA